MKSQRLIDTVKLGPLEISVDPPILYWKGIRQPVWRPGHILMLAALVEGGMMPHEDLAARIGSKVGDNTTARVADLKYALAHSSLPIAIVATHEENSRRLLAYKIEITEGN